MKSPLYLAALCLLLPVFSIAQNKSLGVGTASPNPNAALHVESPTNNQGIIIPRLTTTQRSSLTPALAVGDVGLIVFDTDLRTLTIWNGTAWDLGMKTGEPITAYNAAATGHAGLFENSNSFNSASTINASTAGTGRALEISVSNAANTTDAISISHAGTGNAITANAPIQATQFIGDGSALTNLPAGGLTLPYTGSNATTATALEVTSTGEGNAGSFSVSNPSSSARAIYATTDGSGPAIELEGAGTGLTMGIKAINPLNTSSSLSVDQDGLGQAINASINNASSTEAVVNARTQGIGSVVALNNINAGNTAPVLNINTNGTGNAITANAPIQATQFIGDGSGLTNVPSLTLPYSQNVSDAGSLFNLVNSGTGPASTFEILNPANGANAIMVKTNGLGSVADFSIKNGGNTSPAVRIETNGGGPAIAALGSIVATSFVGDGSGLTNVPGLTLPYSQNVNSPGSLFSLANSGTGLTSILEITNASNTNSALAVGTNGLGTAADFSINNVGSTSPVISISTSGSGPAISAGGSIIATSFTGDGSALTNLPNTFTLPFNGSTAVTGTAFTAETTASSGTAAYFNINNATNNSNTLFVSTNGIGYGLYAQNSGDNLGAASLAVVNPINTSPTLAISHAGTGNAITATAPIQATISGTAANDAVRGVNNSTNGRSAYFSSSNVSNANPGVEILHSGTGAGISISQSNNGLAIHMLNGGMRVPTAVLSGGGSITTRAVAYVVDAPSAPTNYTFPGGFLSEGDLFYFYNTDGTNTATVDGVNIAPVTGVVLIYAGGQLRNFGN